MTEDRPTNPIRQIDANSEKVVLTRGNAKGKCMNENYDYGNKIGRRGNGAESDKRMKQGKKTRQMKKERTKQDKRKHKTRQKNEELEEIRVSSHWC